MDLGLDGRRALVTGASKGIGLAITQALVAEAVSVVAGARTTTPGLDALVQAGSVEMVRVDLASASGPSELTNSALGAGPIDILVKNVGADGASDGFVAVDDDEWLHTLTLTFLAAVRITRAVLPAMAANGRGAIVTVCSDNAFLPDPAVIDYCPAKAALGPDTFRLADFVARILTAQRDARRVEATPQAPFYGSHLDDEILLPGPQARLGATHFDDWLTDPRDRGSRRTPGAVKPTHPPQPLINLPGRSPLGTAPGDDRCGRSSSLLGSAVTHLAVGGQALPPAPSHDAVRLGGHRRCAPARWDGGRGGEYQRRVGWSCRVGSDVC